MIPNSLHCEIHRKPEDEIKMLLAFWPLALWGILLFPVWLLACPASWVLSKIYEKGS